MYVGFLKSCGWSCGIRLLETLVCFRHGILGGLFCSKPWKAEVRSGEIFGWWPTCQPLTKDFTKIYSVVCKIFHSISTHGLS